MSLISRLRFRPPGKPPTKNPSKTLSASISESISESINAIASVAGLISVILAFEHLPETTAIAQVTPDQSLPSPSQVETAADLLTITGGTELGGNLFHSFQEFSVRAGETAFFDHNAAIANIISRVTGTNRSNIDGQIRTNGSANLFLLNPNGILFGNNASLDIGGSFIASTAEGVVFADGSLFSANNAAIPASLLTMTAPMGLQFGNNPGSIVSSSQLPIRSELRLQPNRTLALVGGDLAIAGSVLTAPIGRIELGSVTTAGVVNLNQIEQGWQLDYGEINSTGFGNINLSDRAFVTTDGNGGGNIQVQASNLTLLAGSTISANTQGDLPGGNLLIRATDAIELVGESPDGQFITLFTSSVLPGASGNGGNINVISDRLILRDGAQILSGTFGIGNAGNTNIQARQIELSGIRNDGSTVSGLFATAEPESIGQGGNLTIAADQFVVKDGAQVVVTTFSSGRAGDLTVRAEAIELAGGNPLSPVDVSGFKASADVNSTGDGGNLSIETNRIVIKDGAEAQVSTLGTGNAGNLLLTATESVELVGTSADGLFPSALRAVSGLEGNFTEATGEGGDLTVITDRLEIRDRANIAVSAIGPTGGAGNLTILANRIFLDNQAGLEAETRAGDRGNINLTLGDTLQLLGNSSISTNAIGTATGGNIAISSQTLAALENSDITANSVSNFGGLVSISAQGVFGTTERDSLTPASDITASSELGAQFSGVVEINTPDVDPAQGLLTLPTSFAAENQLVTSACAIDRNLSSAKLLITGRGGLPIAPTVARSGIDIIDDLGDSWPEPPQLSMRSSQTQPELHLNKSADSLDRQALNISSFPQLKSNPDASLPTTLTPPSAIGSQPQLLTGRQVQNKADISSSNSDTAIIEAQGWLHNAHDQVVLVSQLPDLSQNHGSEIGSEPQATTSAKINRINYTDRLAMQSRSRAFGDRHHCYPAASVR
ncbi:S-layer family protein [Thalassoporum mexicanum]|uniref:S-layer family protein n=1 Tax=Thalassoporum mexicanum TaxID=3457544 RepID=UPI0030D9B001